MPRRITIPVRSFGSEVGRPDVPELAEWLNRKRGTEVDLTTYRLERSLDAQEGVTIPAAGGLFYSERLMEVFTGMKDGVLVDEPGVESAAATADALFVRERCKDARIALPAPHILGLRDDYIGDREDFSETIADLYSRLIREMRDQGVQGHVLIADTADLIEFERLAGRNVLFFPRDPARFDFELLLEYQDVLILPATDLDRLADLMERFPVRKLVLLDPEEGEVVAATEIVDADSLEVGGYCADTAPGDYWKRLLGRAFISR